MAKGDDATAGKEERDIQSHRFPPDPKNDRKVEFQGEYISVYNEETRDEKWHEEKVTERKELEVPKGFTVYIIGCTMVCFKT
jgi:hypothetical protein